MQIKTRDLTGAALDWAAANCAGEAIRLEEGRVRFALSQFTDDCDLYSPSTDWAQGGPIIEEEAISLTQFSDYPKWTAKHPESLCIDGPTPLIAAMRCYVASKLGDEVDVPDVLDAD